MSFDKTRSGIPSGILIIYLVIAVEVMFFGGLISAHLVKRFEAKIWPPSGLPVLPIEITAINTIILLLSLIPMYLAVKSINNKKTNLAKWLGITFLLGGIFVGIQGYEWNNLLKAGLTMGPGSSEKIGALPEYVEFSVNLHPSILYNTQKKELQFDRAKLKPSEKIFTIIKSLLILSEDKSYQQALKSLFKIVMSHSHESIIIIPLEKMPSEAILNIYKKKLYYNRKTNELTLRGVLSADDREKLLAISSDKQFRLTFHKQYIRAQSNFGSYFYIIIGAHAFHVLVGLAILMWMILKSLKSSSAITPINLIVVRNYWLFVVSLWPILYYLVYIL